MGARDVIASLFTLVDGSKVTLRDGFSLNTNGGVMTITDAPAGGDAYPHIIVNAVGGVDSEAYIAFQASGSDKWYVGAIVGQRFYINDVSLGTEPFFIVPNSGRPGIGSAPPANASATGRTGEITWDDSFVYVCIATNTWKKVAIATW